MNNINYNAGNYYKNLKFQITKRENQMQTEFCTISEKQLVKSTLRDLKIKLKEFEANNPEVLI